MFLKQLDQQQKPSEVFNDPDKSFTATESAAKKNPYC